MAIDSDIRDQAYLFFVQEAPELLAVIEAELLTLKAERSTAKIHNMMRAAHSIKGGAASVGLETIKTLAHSLEDIFKSLHSEELVIDTEIESLLLQAYDCLRLPLMEQITTGQFNADQAMATAEPVFALIEAQLGDFLRGTAELPSSVELGVDIALSIFEVDVAQGLERLATVLAAPEDKELAGELRAQAEVFAGIAELLNLPGFGALAQTVLAALDAHPAQALQIAQLALADFQAARLAVISGDRTSGGATSTALAELAVGDLDTDEDTANFTLDSVFGGFVLTDEPTTEAITPATPADLAPQLHPSAETAAQQDNILEVLNAELIEVVSSVNSEGNTIPSLDDVFGDVVLTKPAASDKKPTLPATPTKAQQKPETPIHNTPTSQLSVRVDLERLERMNNLVGELAINRNSLSLQNEQLQGTVQELLRRFTKFQELGSQLRQLSDQMIVVPERYGFWQETSAGYPQRPTPSPNHLFDSLEMDSYGGLHSLLQAALEEIVRLEEVVGDVVLVAGQSSQTLEGQRQMIGHLRDDLMWARMLPLGELLNRFPRMLRDLSASYDKPVELKLSGTEVLVDKAALEKLSDPLLHLIRNAFDHGIELPEVRRQLGKPLSGHIEVRAYHQGSQTVIEVRDDGRGLNLERIRSRALEMGLLPPEQLTAANSSRLLELLFEPGFSTANQVTELSGRGVGLDVVRSQMRSLKGSVTVSSEFGIGTTFTLRIPLTLTIAKLLVCSIGSTAFALPSDSIEDILIPQAGQLKLSGGQRFLHWQDQIVPTYHLSELLQYACPLPEIAPSLALVGVPSPKDWAPPILLLQQDNQVLALEIDRLITEQELVIKPLGTAIAPPSYIYGCTILGDGSLIPVIDGAALVNRIVGHTKTVIATAVTNEDSSTGSVTPVFLSRDVTSTLLIVDDSITLRQTLALTLQKAGYRVLQARDGREAIEQLQKNPTIRLVVCDVEMPNMNGFEFLSYRRQDPLLSQIPTVMLTSRSSDKHRQLAMHLGANSYFTKPYIEQEFLAAVKAIITQDVPVEVPALAHS